MPKDTNEEKDIILMLKPPAVDAMLTCTCCVVQMGQEEQPHIVG